MKTNVLLNELVRGMWLMGPHEVSGFAPLVHGILSRNTVPENISTEKLDVLMMDEIGTVLNSAGENEASKIAMVSMIGPVMKYGDWCTYGADEIVGMLDKANNDETVKGIIFYIDGPGGAVSAINPFMDFASRKKKPVVVLSDMAASLHYWTACAVADHIMGENVVSGRFGSVGVVSSFVDAKKHWEEKGYNFHEIYPEESGEKNKVFQLALEGKYDRIKAEHLSPIATKFQAAVREARPNLKENPGVLTGATFTTEEALSLGMIDSIGNMSKAIEMVNVLAEVY